MRGYLHSHLGQNPYASPPRIGGYEIECTRVEGGVIVDCGRWMPAETPSELLERRLPFLRSHDTATASTRR